MDVSQEGIQLGRSDEVVEICAINMTNTQAIVYMNSDLRAQIDIERVAPWVASLIGGLK